MLLVYMLYKKDCPYLHHYVDINVDGRELNYVMMRWTPVASYSYKVV
jgi:hypothetical protein